MAAECTASVSPQPGRCAYFVERKRRFCKMVPAQGRRFCGEHGGHEVVVSPAVNTTGIPICIGAEVEKEWLVKQEARFISVNSYFSAQSLTVQFCAYLLSISPIEFNGTYPQEEDSRKRIPCPLDPKHTVYEDQLQKHLKKCNSREKPKPVYFAQDINAGLKGTTELPEEQVSISTLSKEELENLIRKLRRASESIKSVLKDQILSHQALEEALNDPKNGDAAFKHLKQQASLLGNMERLHLLGPGRCFVEFGAGRGKLSHWVDIALQEAKNVHFLLVERETTRFKVDGKHRKNGFERLQVDIQHLCLNKVPVLVQEKLPVIGIGKHVCGAATDLALRCLVETYANLSDDKEGPAPKRFKTDGTSATSNDSPNESCSKSVTENSSPVAGIVIALCCHHRCDWKHYVGQEFFTTAGLGPVEFNYFKRMSSWATCGMRETATKASTTSMKNKEQSSEAEELDQRHRSVECHLDSLQGLLTTEERKQIGRLCKLLIDHGRIEYLQQRGYEALLQRYTDLSVSLENVLLTAVPCQSSLSTATA